MHRYMYKYRYIYICVCVRFACTLTHFCTHQCCGALQRYDCADKRRGLRRTSQAHSSHLVTYFGSL